MPATILPLIQRSLTQYVMSINLSIGLIGNLCCCIVFFKQSNPRMACSIYFFALSIFASMYLLWSVTPILYTLNNIDPQSRPLAYCKMRLYGSHLLGIYTRYLIVLACADLFFMTQTNVRIRSWSSVKMAMMLTTLMCILSPIIASHLPVFLDLRGSTCGLFDFYKYFFAIYQLIVIAILPSMLMGVFGFLAVRNVHRRELAVARVRGRARDLMRMLVAEIIINFIASIPFSANLLYSAATFNVGNKSLERIELDAFVNFLSQLIIQLIFISPFYLFILSSKSFRRDAKQIIRTCWSKHIRRHNQVAQINAHTLTVSMQPGNIHRQPNKTAPKLAAEMMSGL